MSKCGPKKTQMRSDVYSLLRSAIREHVQNEDIRAALSLILRYRVCDRTAARWKAEVRKDMDPSSYAALKAYGPELRALVLATSSEAMSGKELRRLASKLVGKRIPERTFYRWRSQILQEEREK